MPRIKNFLGRTAFLGMILLGMIIFSVALTIALGFFGEFVEWLNWKYPSN